ncbi:MAG: glycosyltransferase family 39 protein, partial [Dialister sp.]|nr:glycosyltransferase family 39 protein [Dialister sp.]
ETEKAPELPVYIDTFYRPSVAFYTDIYGKALPEFDERKRRETAKNEADGVLLPGKDNSLTLPDHAYILVQKKIYDHWPEKLKAEARLLWEKDTAVFLERHAES